MSKVNCLNCLDKENCVNQKDCLEPLDKDVESSIELIEDDCGFYDYDEEFTSIRDYANWKIIKQALREKDKRIKELEESQTSKAYFDLAYQYELLTKKINAIREIVEETDRRVYYNFKDKYYAIKEVIK